MPKDETDFFDGAIVTMDQPENGSGYDIGIVVKAAKAGTCSVYWMRAREEYEEEIESLAIHTPATRIVRETWLR